MLSTAPVSNGSSQPSTKKPLFAKPSWSKVQNVGSSEIFHRSDQTYLVSTADAKCKRKGNLAKKGKEKERARQSHSVERASKRQRIAAAADDDDDENKSNRDENEDDDDDDDEGDNEGECDDSGSEKSDSHILTHMPTNSPPRSISALVDDYQKKIEERLKKLEQDRPYLPNVINLDDDESFTEAPKVLRAKSAEGNEMLELIEHEITPSDEEFPELARKAREKSRRHRLEQDVAPLTADIPSSASSDPPHMSPSRIISPPPDPVLQILITSSIPNTTPLIVARKLGQRLKDVRLAWTDRQNFSNELKDNVFLTWRGKRLFDVTTCKSLGVTVDLDGKIMAKNDILGDDEGRIHMEAMTYEILEARRRAKTQEATKAEDVEAEDETPRSIEAKGEAQVRIILKARGFGDLKLKVKPTTPISRILNAFRHANKIDSEKDVYILFEGERLEPTHTIEDSEIADLDSLDTYVK